MLYVFKAWFQDDEQLWMREGLVCAENKIAANEKVHRFFYRAGRIMRGIELLEAEDVQIKEDLKNWE